MRVEIPAYSGKWYPLVEAEFDSNFDGSVDPGEDIDSSGNWDLVAELAMADVFAVRGDIFLTSTSDLRYRLELSPPIIPGADPIVFPQGVGIDLQGSSVPDAWRATPTGPGNFSLTMDIMFASNGALTGPLAGSGLLHLYFADIEDIEAARRCFARESGDRCRSEPTTRRVFSSLRLRRIPTSWSPSLLKPA